MSATRFLVLGLGFFGKKWLREISSCAECEVAGIVSKHPDLLATVGDELKVPAARRFATIEEGLDPSRPQAVLVALPERVHKAAIVATLDRGLPVLTEKPLAMTTAEAREIVQAVRRTPGSVVMVDQNYRWRPQTQALRKAVSEGKIGQIVAAS
jgi:predicted dehydrogenase